MPSLPRPLKRSLSLLLLRVPRPSLLPLRSLGEERVSLRVAHSQLSLAFVLLTLLYPLIAQEALSDGYVGAPMLWWVVGLSGLMCSLGGHWLLGWILFWAVSVLVSTLITMAVSIKAPLRPSVALCALLFILLAGRLWRLTRHTRDTQPLGYDLEHLGLFAWARRSWRELSVTSKALIAPPVAAMCILWVLEVSAPATEDLDARLALPYILTLAPLTLAILWGVSRGRRAPPPPPTQSEPP